MSADEQPASPESGGIAELGFGDAMAELEAILRRVEGEEVDIDRLAEELRRAAVLLELCRSKIRRAEVEIAQVVHQLGDGEER